MEQMTAPVDAQINHATQLDYWTAQTADVTGMLGGYPQVSRIDLQGSRNFLAKIRRLDRQTDAALQKDVSGQGKSSARQPNRGLNRAVDCGAGIGRITRGLLLSVANRVDIVEPVKKFTDELVEQTEAREGAGLLGAIYNVGLEKWQPEHDYELVWVQWCVGHLSDKQMVEFLKRAASSLTRGENGSAIGVIVVKENLSTEPDESDVYDAEDSSVTRSDAKFKAIFDEAGLQVIKAEVQTGFPRELFPVKMYALRL